MGKKGKAQAKEVFMDRAKCDCMGQKHDLINNCLNCGKVVCARQGEGNCLYCGKLVTRPDGLFIDDSQQYFPQLPKTEQEKVSQERSKAIQHKNRLVERDKAQNQNQNIFDEHVDYYEISQNKWLDESDRQKAIDKILEKDQMIESETYKTKVKYDMVTGEFVREEFAFDEEAFKKEGQKFLEGREQEDKVKKQEVARSKHSWDQRVLKNEKMRDVMKQVLNEKHNAPQIKRRAVENVTEVIIEE